MHFHTTKTYVDLKERPVCQFFLLRTWRTPELISTDPSVTKSAEDLSSSKRHQQDTYVFYCVKKRQGGKNHKPVWRLNYKIWHCVCLSVKCEVWRVRGRLYVSCQKGITASDSTSRNLWAKNGVFLARSGQLIKCLNFLMCVRNIILFRILVFLHNSIYMYTRGINDCCIDYRTRSLGTSISHVV